MRKYTRRKVLAKMGGTLAVGAVSTTEAAVPILSPDIYEHIADLALQSASCLIEKPGLSLSLEIPQAAYKTLMPVLRDFSQQTKIDIHANTHANLNVLSNNLLLGHMAADTTYDLALVTTYEIPDLVRTGGLLALDDLADRFEMRPFIEISQKEMGNVFDGALYGLVAGCDTYLLFYNRNWLENPTHQAKYADLYDTPLQVPRTWDEFHNQLAFFHDPERENFGGALRRNFDDIVWEWWGRFHAKGIWPLSTDAQPQIHSPAGVAALEDMIACNEYRAYHLALNADNSYIQPFTHGQTWCCNGWGATQKKLYHDNAELRAMMLCGQPPGGVIEGVQVDVPCMNTSWSYVINAASQKAELAFLLAAYISNARISSSYLRHPCGFFNPYLPDHFTDSNIVGLYGQDFLKKYNDILNRSIPRFYILGYGQYFATLSRWIFHAMRGDVTPEDAMRRASHSWSKITSRIGWDKQRVQWQKLRASYPPIYQSLMQDY